MDISKLDVIKLSNEGYECVIKNPKNGKDTDIKVIIQGIHADGFMDESIKADDAKKTASFLAKFTKGWENIEENGKPVNFSIKEAERVYLDYPIIRSQVLSAAMDVKNFILD
jgi:hypothetical protein